MLTSYPKVCVSGPDWLNGEFFQNNWEVIKTVVCSAVDEFFSSGIIEEDVNDTLVSLTPKIPHPESISQLRLISCCNYIYKIMSKIMVSALKPLLNIFI